MAKNVKTLLFDLDGTILDTNELIIQSFLHVLRDIAPSGFGREHIIPGMGHPLVEQLQRFSNQEEVSDLISAYREINLKLHDDYVKPFPHVQEVLQRLQSAGFNLGIVTTKMRLTTERGLRYTGLDKYLSPHGVITFDEVEHPKPHPQPVEMAMEALGAEPSSTVMIGDSVVDMQSALAAGCTAIGVAWSLKGAQLLHDSGAHCIIEDMRDLYAIAGLERRPFA